MHSCFCCPANLHFSIPWYLVWLFSVILILILPVLNSRVSVFFRLSSKLNPANCFSVRCFKHQYQKYAQFSKNQCTKSLWKHLCWLFNIFLYFTIREPQKLMQTYLRNFIRSILCMVHWFHWLISPGVILSWINTSDNLTLPLDSKSSRGDQFTCVSFYYKSKKKLPCRNSFRMKSSPKEIFYFFFISRFVFFLYL